MPQHTRLALFHEQKAISCAILLPLHADLQDIGSSDRAYMQYIEKSGHLGYQPKVKKGRALHGADSEQSMKGSAWAINP